MMEKGVGNSGDRSESIRTANRSCSRNFSVPATIDRGNGLSLSKRMVPRYYGLA